MATDIRMQGRGASGACELHSLVPETVLVSPLSGDDPTDPADPADPQVFQGALHIAVGDGSTTHQMLQEEIAALHQVRITSSGAPSQGVDSFLRADPVSVGVDVSPHAESPLEDGSQGIAREVAGAEVAIQENYIESCLFSELMNVVDLARNAMHGWGVDFLGIVAKVSHKAAEYATSLMFEEAAPSLGKDTWDELATVVVSVNESIATSSYTAVQKWLDILNNIAVRKLIEASFSQMTEAVANDISKVLIGIPFDPSPRKMKSISQGLQAALKTLAVCSLDRVELDMTRFWKRAISGAFISMCFSAEPELNKQTIKFMSIGAKALTAKALLTAVPGLGEYPAADLAVVLFPVVEPAVAKLSNALSNALVDAAFELFLNSEGMDLYFEGYEAHGEYA